MILPLLLIASQPAPATTPALDCDDPITQQDMNQCAALDYAEADKALNEQWEKTSAEHKLRDENFESTWDDRPGYFDTLLAAQRAWLIYRDAHCRSEGYYARGGSLEPLLVSTCKTTLTELRAQQLQFLIEQ